MFTPSVRGNLLDLEHFWHNADGPASFYDLPPSHLNLVWQHQNECSYSSDQRTQKISLPYWLGVSNCDREAVTHFQKEVAALLTRQGVRLKWNETLLPDSPRTVENDTTCPGLVKADKGKLLPAFTLLTIPTDLKPRRPRYDHSHFSTAKVESGPSQAGSRVSDVTSQPETTNHPTVRVRWPKGGNPLALRDFMLEALVAEGIKVWPCTVGLRDEPRQGRGQQQFHNVSQPALALVTAPWFTRNQAGSPDQTIIRHMAITIAKLDLYLFAPTLT